MQYTIVQRGHVGQRTQDRANTNHQISATVPCTMWCGPKVGFPNFFFLKLSNILNNSYQVAHRSGCSSMHLSASLCHMRPVQASASIVVWSLSRPPSHFQCFLWGPDGVFNVSYGARLGGCGVPFRHPRDFFVLFFCPRIRLLSILLFNSKNASWGSSSLVSGGPLTAKKCDSVRDIL